MWCMSFSESGVSGVGAVLDEFLGGGRGQGDGVSFWGNRPQAARQSANQAHLEGTVSPASGMVGLRRSGKTAAP